LITSLQNQQIKWLQQLEKPKVRKAESLFIVEGLSELRHAVSSGYAVEKVFYCSEVVSESTFNTLSLNLNSVERIEVSKSVFEKIAYRESTGGVIAVVQTKDFPLSKLSLCNNAFILVIESVEKPGNLGAMLRTADAAGLDAVIIADPHTDIFNPNVVRSSVGTLFTCNIGIGSNEEVFGFLNLNDFKIYGAALCTEHLYHQTCYEGNCALIMGTESTGLSRFWIEKATELVKIPMRGKNDSLNVSVSAAVICFEAMRQRGFKKT